MPRPRKPRSFWEPWRPDLSVALDKPPNVEGLPEDAAQSILDAHARVLENAPYFMWGSRMADPHVTSDWMGATPTLAPGDRTLFQVHKLRGLPDGSPTHAEVAKRIAECVNAMAGIADPARFITDVRVLLQTYRRGECLHDPRHDPKVWSLSDRCIPPEELERILEQDDAEDL